MTYTRSDVLTFVEENDVKFIRLTFVDLTGQPKNIAIMPDQLEEAFQYGVSFDASAIRGFSDVDSSDLLLFPDPGTFILLPWRPGKGRVARFFCEIRNPDGSPFACDARAILQQTVAEAETMGYRMQVGAECEFYLFKTDETGAPLLEPHDRGGYLDLAPLDKGEDVRREICLSLEEMGIRPESSHHEQGPGQNEIDFRYGGVLETADNFISFKTVVKSVAAAGGLYASFMPKPLPQAAGSGMHINLSMTRGGENIFGDIRAGANRAPEQFIAGVLRHIGEITVFLNPTVSSYARLGKEEAPGYVSWSHHNRSQLVRIPAAGGERRRMELRSPDPTANPYLALALIIRAGLDGMASGLTLPEPCDLDLFNAPDEAIVGLERLPVSLGEALARAEDSAFVRASLDGEVLRRYFALKRAELSAWERAGDKAKFSRETYFEVL